MEQSRDYTIIDFDEQRHEIIVRFNQFDDTKGVIVPIEDGKYITGVALDNYITSFCPIIPVIKPQVASNADEIKKLVNYKFSERLKLANIKKEHFDLRARLLASSDWTQLPDANSNLDDQDRKMWLQYRQDLRDITKQPGWPHDVDWPKRPHILGVAIFG